MADGDQTSAFEPCAWCGERVEPGAGIRLAEEPGERHAAFCRLEHVVPWALQGAHWEPGSAAEPAALGEGLAECAQCGAGLDDVRVLLVSHRGEHRIPDAFCSVDHAAGWAKAGGRWH